MPFFERATDIKIHGGSMNDIGHDSYHYDNQYHGNTDYGGVYHGQVNNRGNMGGRNNANPFIQGGATSPRSFQKPEAGDEDDNSSTYDNSNDELIAHLKEELEEAREERDKARAKCTKLERDLLAAKHQIQLLQKARKT
ncbi:hypothetical protein BDQ12DRAFT_687143 [Crucibulum laeve]|uniref:Uncharacterized protein n=1 Tax=Crucibulum laeve TaxID=68775 RepID=A0A5C3LU14_9AGAR|nr:hypothetical protein BDQ12DRAFT_687143 [Crucibulum laeve]